ncbi:MAG: hypothetical protein ACI9VR_004794 [Cognaticolwellia sp.]|jgi:hypothetical protein
MTVAVSLFSSAPGPEWEEQVTFDWNDIPDASWGFGFELNRYGENGLLIGEIGEVYLWDSPPESIEDLSSPDAGVEGVDSSFLGFLNTTLSADLTGDGVDELVLGGMFGRVDVFEGGVAGQVLNTDSDWWLLSEGSYEPEAMGGSPRAVDVDGDGYPELALSDLSYSEEFVNGGAVWILPGQWSGSTDTTASLASVRGSEAEGRLGRSVEFVDGNADGIVELVVSEAGTGDVYLFDTAGGLGTWTTDDSTATMVGITNGECSAEFLGLDADLDGYDDLMTGCPDSGSGSVHVLLSPGM